MRQFITSVIGDDYKNWKPKDCVVITSPTGSGKSTFVLQTLLPYAVDAKKHIVYICNRKVLKEQFSEFSKRQLRTILETVDDVPDEHLSNIHVTTYQFCEQSKQFPEFGIKPDLNGLSRIEKKKRKMQGKIPPDTHISSNDVMYYIFDEAHYFIADAVFNANTNYWYGKGLDYSIEDFKHSVYIFLTATSEPLMCFLGCRNNSNWFSSPEIANSLLDRSSLRIQLSEQTVLRVKLHEKGKPDHGFKMNSERYINERCREIRPFETPISKLKEFIEQGNKIRTGYHLYDHTFPLR